MLTDVTFRGGEGEGEVLDACLKMSSSVGERERSWMYAYRCHLPWGRGRGRGRNKEREGEREVNEILSEAYMCTATPQELVELVGN